MPRVRRFDHVVLDVGVKAMLWAKQSYQRNTGLFGKAVSDVTTLVIDRRGVRDQSEPFASKPVRCNQAFDAECQRHRAIID